jgi:hypothetical protein
MTRSDSAISLWDRYRHGRSHGYTIRRSISYARQSHAKHTKHTRVTA